MTRASLPLQETEQLASGSALEAAADLALALRGAQAGTAGSITDTNVHTTVK